MIGPVNARIDFNPADPVDLPQAAVTARLQIAALKTQQEIAALQMQELARLLEPHKGSAIDARA